MAIRKLLSSPFWDRGVRGPVETNGLHQILLLDSRKATPREKYKWQKGSKPRDPWRGGSGLKPWTRRVRLRSWAGRAGGGSAGCEKCQGPETGSGFLRAVGSCGRVSMRSWYLQTEDKVAVPGRLVPRLCRLFAALPYVPLSHMFIHWKSDCVKLLPSENI